MARIFDRKLAITYRCLQAVVLLGYLLGYKIGWQKVLAHAHSRSGVRFPRAPGVASPRVADLASCGWVSRCVTDVNAGIRSIRGCNRFAERLGCCAGAYSS